MIVIPVSRRPDWRNPPIITLLLILVNTLVFFGLQSGDGKRIEKAYDYYAHSILVKTELPHYIQYLEGGSDPRKAEIISKAFHENQWQIVLRVMEQDQAFMEKLRSGKIIQPTDKNYFAWQNQRNEFERRLNNTIIGRFAFKSAQPTLAGWIGHMFLHGDFMHLLGNMAFLFIVGYMVEEALGKGRYLLFYLLSGIGSCACYLLTNTPSMIPALGASGAISGVMAMYVALYGMRKIRFFYWVLIYFDFFRAPAIIILPFWIAKELYQYFTDHASMINYMAHFGGFVMGAALVGLYRLLTKKQLAVPEQEAPADPRKAPLARIDILLNALRLDEARRELRRLADLYPDDLAIVNRYYQVARHAPESDEYHHAASLIFALPEYHLASGKLIYDTFTEYLKLAKPTPRFSDPQLITLIRRLTRLGHIAEAKRLTQALARRSPQQEELPDLLQFIAKASQNSRATKT